MLTILRNYYTKGSARERLRVMLYELLTGSPPLDAKQFKRGAILEMLRMVREVDPPRPSTRLSTADALPNIAANRSIEPARLSKLLQGELDWVVMKALEKDRTRRYDTANGFARDIQRYLADEVVEARPPSAGYRLKKFVYRNKASVIAASAVAASLLIGVVAFAWQAKVARDQRDLAVMAQEAEAQQRKIAVTARDAEAAARKQTELALTESQGKTARMTYERAQALCEGGQADVGLLWMARSLELTPPGPRTSTTPSAPASICGGNSLTRWGDSGLTNWGATGRARIGAKAWSISPSVRMA